MKEKILSSDGAQGSDQIQNQKGCSLSLQAAQTDSQFF